jgi:hypothetical protein
MAKTRSRLSREAAWQHYVEVGEEVLLDLIEADARAFDASAKPEPLRRVDARDVLPLGVFTSIDAHAVADREGKTRGAVTNVFGSQRAFQAAVMFPSSLWDFGGIENVEYPSPNEFANDEEWIRAIALIEAGRGPKRGQRPPRGYATHWLLWLSHVPYDLWSKELATRDEAEFQGWVTRIDNKLLKPALEHFSLQIRKPHRSLDLAVALANVVEGLWLTQAVTQSHDLDPTMSVDEAAQNAFLFLWRGGVEPVV